MAPNCFTTAPGADTLKSGEMLRNSLIFNSGGFFKPSRSNLPGQTEAIRVGIKLET